MELENLKQRMLTWASEIHLLLGELPSIIEYETRYKVPREDVVKAISELKDQFQTRFGVDIYELYLEKPKLKKGVELDFGETFDKDSFSIVEKKVEKTDEVQDLPGRFVMAVSIICQTTDKRSTTAKLKAIGVSNQLWEGYLRNPVLRQYFEERLNEAFDRVEFGAKLGIARNVEAGDLNSIKYYHEYTGRYRPNAELTMNLGIIIGRLMEILSAKLSPELLVEVAEEIEQLMAPAQNDKAS